MSQDDFYSWYWQSERERWHHQREDLPDSLRALYARAREDEAIREEGRRRCARALADAAAVARRLEMTKPAAKPEEASQRARDAWERATASMRPTRTPEEQKQATAEAWERATTKPIPAARHYGLE